MHCIYTNRHPEWVLYHLKMAGSKGRVIDSIKEVDPPSPFGEQLVYIMTSEPPSLPPWGELWVCGDKDNDTPDIDYGRDIISSCLGILDRELCAWLLKKYSDYPGALERLLLKLKVVAVVKGAVITIPDVIDLIPTSDATPFLWEYQKTVGSAQGLKLLHASSITNSDLWKTYMVDSGLMKYLKVYHPQLVYSLLSMRVEVDRGMRILDSALLWHLSTINAML